MVIGVFIGDRRRRSRTLDGWILRADQFYQIRICQQRHLTDRLTHFSGPSKQNQALDVFLGV
jgi:hypothetical protein